jgi:IS1 family transposase
MLAEHQDTAFIELKTLLEPSGIMQSYTDDWGAYERYVEPVFHTVGKANTQTIECKQLMLRTRIKRLARNVFRSNPIVLKMSQAQRLSKISIRSLRVIL